MVFKFSLQIDDKLQINIFSSISSLQCLKVYSFLVCTGWSGIILKVGYVKKVASLFVAVLTIICSLCLLRLWTAAKHVA